MFSIITQLFQCTVNYKLQLSPLNIASSYSLKSEGMEMLECFGLEDRYEAVNLRTMSLCHTLRDPHDVPALLFFESDVSVEDTEVKLIHERFLHQCHLNFKEAIFQRFAVST